MSVRRCAAVVSVVTGFAGMLTTFYFLHRRRARPSSPSEFHWKSGLEPCGLWNCPFEENPQTDGAIPEEECHICLKDTPFRGLLECPVCKNKICILCQLKIFSFDTRNQESRRPETLLRCPYCRKEYNPLTLEQLRIFYIAHKDQIPLERIQLPFWESAETDESYSEGQSATFTASTVNEPASTSSQSIETGIEAMISSRRLHWQRLLDPGLARVQVDDSASYFGIPRRNRQPPEPPSTHATASNTNTHEYIGIPEHNEHRGLYNSDVRMPGRQEVFQYLDLSGRARQRPVTSPHPYENVSVIGSLMASSNHPPRREELSMSTLLALENRRMGRLRLSDFLVRATHHPSYRTLHNIFSAEIFDLEPAVRCPRPSGSLLSSLSFHDAEGSSVWSVCAEDVTVKNQDGGFCEEAQDSILRHHWVYVEAFEAGHYCNVCEMSTFHGAECDFCGIIVDDACMGKANAAIACKSLATVSHSLKHHWVNGNLGQGSVCAVCEDLCGDGPGLQDFKCCWCQRTIHKDCMESYTSICDLGRVVRPDIPNWSPVIVVANRKSGNGEGDVVLQAYRRLLNPAQVLDLAEIQPETGLEWCRLIPDVECRVLVAGGDGTVGWILGAVENLQLDPAPKVGLLPLGTGNDLSRVLGYGPGHTGPIDSVHILEKLSRAVPVRLDRWNVEVKYFPRFGIRRPNKSFRMSNYLSIGVDALVTLNFHNKRHTLPRVMSGRFMNKFLFFTYGTKDVLDRACKNLYKGLHTN